MLLVGSEGTLDLNIDPHGKVYGNRAQSDNGATYGAFIRAVKEYPPGSGKVVACGGSNSKTSGVYTKVDMSLGECET